jgi:hypothetical protein
MAFSGLAVGAFEIAKFVRHRSIDSKMQSHPLGSGPANGKPLTLQPRVGDAGSSKALNCGRNELS